MATIVPPDVVPVPQKPLAADESIAQPPTPSADRAELEMLQDLLKLQQKATQTAMDQIEELKKQLPSTHFPAQTDIGEKASEVVLPNIPAFSQDYWPAAREEPPAIPPTYTGAVAAVVTLAVALTIIVCCVVFWASSGNPLPWLAHSPVAPVAPVARVAPLPPAVDTLSPVEPSTAFGVSLADLTDAFSLFPGKSPTDLLWEASRKDSSCLLQWNDGYPSFLFGAGEPHPQSLAFTIGQCADAVRRLRSPNSR